MNIRWKAFFLILGAGAGLSTCFAAGGSGLLREASSFGGPAYVGDLVHNDSPSVSYIWANKVTFAPGEQIQLRWTVKPNNDLYPYTFFCYRQNLQTGEKLYLPGLTAEATDIQGRTAAQRYTIATIPGSSKVVLLGPGGQFPLGSAAAPADLGTHQFVMEIRDHTATRVVKASYFKFGVVSGEEQLAGDITTDRTLVRTKRYVLKGGVFVMPGATLSIESGTFIVGDVGALSFLCITRGGKIIANGTRARPIVFTSGNPVGQRDRGDWGGILLNGKAPINVPGGVGQAEGIDDQVRGAYGGTDPFDNSGILRYVRVEFGGFRITPTNELNGVTFHGVGKGTTVEHVQSSFGADDAYEWFGGTVDAKWLAGAYYDDDGFDWVEGWTGRFQYGVLLQRGDRADNGIEADNNNKAGRDVLPRANPLIYNLTLVGDPSAQSLSGEGIQLREGTAGNINNAIVLGFGQAGLRVDHPETIAQAAAGDLKVSSTILWQNSEGKTDYDSQFNADGKNFVATQQNISVIDPRLANPFQFNDPDFRPKEGSPIGMPGNAMAPPDDGFFDTSASFIGAFGFGQMQWTEEWTNLLNEADLAP